MGTDPNNEKKLNDDSFDEEVIYYIEDESEDIDNEDIIYYEESNEEDFEKKVKLSKKSKILIFSSLALIILLIASYFIYKKIAYNKKPDAVVSTADLGINITVEGYDGYASAIAEKFGDVKLLDVKDIMMADFIKDSIKISDIRFNKNNKLKNGDTVIARIKLSSENFNIVFDNDIIKKEYTVSGLKEIVNDYKDIRKDLLSKINVKINDDMEYEVSGRQNLDIKRYGIFQNKMNEEEIQNYIGGAIDNSFSILIVEKVNYLEDYFEDQNYKTMYFVYELSNFETDGDSMKCSFKRVSMYDYISDSEIDDMIMNWGYKKIWY